MSDDISVVTLRTVVERGEEPLMLLSPRQLEVLNWVAKGKTAWETSVILQCSEATVNYHLKQVFRKLDATNKIQAVTRAMMLGVLK